MPQGASPTQTGAGFDPARVDLNLLRILAMVLSTRNVTQAADQLGMTQPAVSRALARLRLLFGDPLLIRSNGRMQLTHYASRLAGPLAAWMGHLGDLVALAPFSPETMQRRFRIAVSDYGAQTSLMPTIQQFRTLAPMAALEILPLDRNSARGLGAGEIDLILTGAMQCSAQFHRRVLFDDDFICLMDRDHPWRAGGDGARMDLESWLAYPHIGIAMVHEGKELIDLVDDEAPGRARHMVVSVPYFHLAPAMLVDDLVLTLPRRFGAGLADCGRVVAVEAPGELGKFTFSAFWSERSRSDEALMWMVDMLAGNMSPAT